MGPFTSSATHAEWDKPAQWAEPQLERAASHNGHDGSQYSCHWHNDVSHAHQQFTWPYSQ